MHTFFLFPRVRNEAESIGQLTISIYSEITRVTQDRTRIQELTKQVEPYVGHNTTQKP